MATVFDLIAGTYVTMYARAADPEGAVFWANQLGFNSLPAASISQADISLANQLGQNFYAVSKLAFDAKYTPSMTDVVFIDNVYQNLGGLSADLEGAAFWGNRLLDLKKDIDPQVARSMVAAEIGFALQTFDANATGDAAIRAETYRNKIAISQAAAATGSECLTPVSQSMTDWAYKGLTDVLIGVDNTKATRDIAIAQIYAAARCGDEPTLMGITNAGDHASLTSVSSVVKEFSNAAAVELIGIVGDGSISSGAPFGGG